eukprot:5455881-Amphidinium_carterae.1
MVLPCRGDFNAKSLIFSPLSDALSHEIARSSREVKTVLLAVVAGCDSGLGLLVSFGHLSLDQTVVPKSRAPRERPS